MQANTKHQYWPALDGVRGLAILAVMLFHFKVPGAWAGFLGVDAFFVLSGFLITSLLVAEWDSTGGISLLRFYQRRMLRLFPALWALLLIVSPLVPWHDVVVTMGYVSNWAIALHWSDFQRRALGHLWSLSIEEQYYLVWPLALSLLLRRCSRRTLIGVPVALATVVTVCRAILWRIGLPWSHICFGSDMRADGLLIGSVLGLAFTRFAAHEWSRLARYARPATIAALLALAVTLATVRSGPSILAVCGFTSVGLGVAVVIARVVVLPSRPVIRFLSWTPLVAAGQLSYALYLWHVPVDCTLSAIGLRSGPTASLVLRLALSLIPAALSYRFIERPALQLKRRLRPAVLATPSADHDPGLQRV